MASARFTPAARDDLSEIRRYIAQDNPERAKTFVLEIRDHCRRLADHPKLHPVARNLDDTARKAVHGNYLIFYDEVEEGIIVLRVLHSARDVASLVLRET